MRLRVRRDLLTRTGRTITTSEDAIRRRAEEYARENGWVLNPDKDVLDRVIRGLARNEQRFGHRYCPCRILSRDEEKDKPIICPCIYHKDEIAKDGRCHCMLYFRKDAARSMEEENQ